MGHGRWAAVVGTAILVFLSSGCDRAVETVSDLPIQTAEQKATRRAMINDCISKGIFVAVELNPPVVRVDDSWFARSPQDRDRFLLLVWNYSRGGSVHIVHAPSGRTVGRYRPH